MFTYVCHVLTEIVYILHEWIGTHQVYNDRELVIYVASCNEIPALQFVLNISFCTTVINGQFAVIF